MNIDELTRAVNAIVEMNEQPPHPICKVSTRGIPFSFNLLVRRDSSVI